MKKIITLPRSTVIDAARARGVSACEEINRLLSASLGYRVCSHLLREDNTNGTLVFSFARECVPTRCRRRSA